MEGNLPTGHRVTVRTGLPTAYWKLLNQGVPGSKSTTAQVDEGSGIMQAWSEIDRHEAELNGNTSEYRLSEAAAFVQAMNQQMARTLFYGNSGLNPEQFNGLSVRFSSKTAQSGANIVDAGGTGADNTSIWLIDWGKPTICGTFPKGSMAGLTHEDKGLVTLETAGNKAEGRRQEVYQDKWEWKMGIAQKDWRYQVRIANIDVSDLKKADPTDITELLIMALYRLEDMSGNLKIYMNRTVLQYLDIQRLRKVQQSGITFEVIDGKYIPMFRGIPIRRVDRLLNSEARVV